ncbi:hypothetical protein Zmor_011565 [Zophobas morio]|uniref:Uncharacterized protein n=1 Tax=Zophobas morio TaxID=2755281 RepID=A0AA38MLA3_9CUCU|nr:hypothetical protein Zmor_011565 [Zophobas morio]
MVIPSWTATFFRTGFSWTWFGDSGGKRSGGTRRVLNDVGFLQGRRKKTARAVPFFAQMRRFKIGGTQTGRKPKRYLQWSVPTGFCTPKLNLKTFF